ncbi:CGNR zinc finger domain-containing protein [Streptomyces sp. NPDC001796]|uniref:CGNR zinc finger domain-containing protein n=1 Tax=Streptomyces sp. NPDC001796 TaxID=3364609 RepID=UPI0036B2F32D
MLFLPAHPRRRWCSAARCGNRVRVARHYQRRKAGQREWSAPCTVPALRLKGA